MGQPGLGQTFIITVRRAGGGEKSPPGQGQTLAAKGPGDSHAVDIIGIEHGIGNKKVPGALLLQLTGFFGDLIG